MSNNTGTISSFIHIEHKQPHYLSLILAIYLLLSIPLQKLQQLVITSTDSYLVHILLGLVSGTIFYFWEPFGRDYQGITFMPAQDLLAVFLPIYIVASIYQMDFYIFIRCLPHVLMICLLCNLINSLLLLIFIHYILHPKLRFVQSILLTLAFMPIQPKFIQNILKDLAKYRHLGTILEGESLVSLIPQYTLFVMFRGINSGILDCWTHYVTFLLRNLLGGAIIGFVLGKLQTFLLQFVYNEGLQALAISVGMSFFTYYLSEYVLSVSGIFAMILLATYLAGAKHKFSFSLDQYLVAFWNTVLNVSEVGFLVVLVAEYVPYIIIFFDVKNFYASFVIYLCTNLFRFLSFCLIGCLFKLLPFKLDIKTFIILGWSNIKGCINLCMVLILLVEPETFQIAKPLTMELLFFVILSMLINNTTMRTVLRLVGLNELSASRRSNMNNCMKFILECRDSILKTLKTYKYLSGSNWDVVRHLTNLKHPYKIEINDLNCDDEDFEFIFHANSAICPECLKEIPFELSPKEFAEMFLEARSRVLKAKKVYIIRQYEEGVITKNCLQALIHHIELMIESKDHNTRIRLTNYLQPSSFLLFIREFLADRMRAETVIEPIGKCRRGAYYLVNHIAYDYLIFIITLVYVVYIFFTLFVVMKNRDFLVSSIFLGIYIIDQTLRLSGRHRDIPLIHHFLDIWNAFDFVVLVLELWTYFFVVSAWPFDQNNEAFIYSVWLLKVFGLCRLLRLISLLKSTLPSIISMLDNQIDTRIAFGFDIASALMFCCDEILDNIGQIVELRVMREIFVKDLQEEKAYLIMKMQKVQKERPWIAITIKTKQVIRTTLTAMTEALNELKSSGFVDQIEYKFVKKEIMEKMKFLRDIQFVRPSEPRVIFKEVPWIKEKLEIIDFLYNKVETVTWDAGQTIMRDKKHSNGIYIVVTGLLRLKYVPKQAEVPTENFGYIPIVDYLSTINFDKEYEDNIMSGSSFGELCLLTGRPYSCTIIADSPCQAYMLKNELIKDAMAMDNNPVTGLEAKMWKHATINLAIDLMMKNPFYSALTQEEIKFKLDRAFVPNLKCYKVFYIIDEMEDVLLIDGSVYDTTSNEVLQAPVVIPQSTKKLLLPKSSILEIEENIISRLMIIPIVEGKEIEIMRKEEEIAEIVSVPTSHCILHDFDDKVTRKMKQKRQIFGRGILSRPSLSSKSVRTSNLEIINLDSQAYLSGQTSIEDENDRKEFHLLNPQNIRLKTMSLLPGAIDTTDSE